MNKLERTCKKQEKRINTQRKQIDALTSELESLKKENAELVKREQKYKEQVKAVDETIEQFNSMIADAIEVKAEYQKALRETKQMKSNYTKKYKPLLGQLKRQLLFTPKDKEDSVNDK